jgi:hypothetical protein
MINYGKLAVKPSHRDGCCKVSGSVVYAGGKTAQNDESEEFSTTDGEVIDSSAGSDAIKKGTGMFIGGYFVGILDSLSGVAAAPFLRY